MTKESNSLSKTDALNAKKISIVKGTIDYWRTLSEDKITETILAGDFILAHQAVLSEYVSPGEETLAGGWSIKTTSNSPDRVGTLYASPSNIRGRSTWLRGVSAHLDKLKINSRYHAAIVQTHYYGRFADLPELAYVLSRMGTPWFEDYISLTSLFSDRDHSDWRVELGISKIPELQGVSRQAHLRINAMINAIKAYSRRPRKGPKPQPSKKQKPNGDKKWVREQHELDPYKDAKVDPVVAETSFTEHAPHIQQEHAEILAGTTSPATVAE